MYSLDDNRKIGIGLSTAGVLFTILGVLLFFDRALLAMGNVRANYIIHHPSGTTPRARAHSPRLTRACHGACVPQLLFLAGVLLIIGPAKTYRFFFQVRKAKGTACFLGGICIVLYGWPVVGMCVEGWGFINLFGDFFPTALCAARARPRSATHALPKRLLCAVDDPAMRCSCATAAFSALYVAVRAEASSGTCRSLATSSRSSRCVGSPTVSSPRVGCQFRAPEMLCAKSVGAAARLVQM